MSLTSDRCKSNTRGMEQDRLKEVVGRFEEAYPDGLDFAPNASDADFA